MTNSQLQYHSHDTYVLKFWANQARIQREAHDAIEHHFDCAQGNGKNQ
ncbi:hypothetical protein VRRI112168_01750 [Vreelandella rituensis]|nr:hypothetical protein [Halomonas rituensis]